MIDDREELQRELQANARQAALSFLSENLEVDWRPPKPPEVLYDEVDVAPIKLDFLGFG